MSVLLGYVQKYRISHLKRTKEDILNKENSLLTLLCTRHTEQTAWLKIFK